MNLELQLRADYDQGKDVSHFVSELSNSNLVHKLIDKSKGNGLTKIFSLVALAEIPYTQELKETQKIISTINQTLATPEGFSYTGSMEDIVPCYNAMLLSAYCRMSLGESLEAQNALNWIKHYQVFNRLDRTTWSGKGICRHGDCLNEIPCYIGVGKSVKALLTYQELVRANDVKVNKLIEEGLAYMLKHQMYLRLSVNSPITPHIINNIFPESYFLSLTDLVYIVGKGKVKSNQNTQPLLQLLEDKRTMTGGWKTDYIYRYPGYVPFEASRKDSEWLEYLYNSWLQ